MKSESTTAKPAYASAAESTSLRWKIALILTGMNLATLFAYRELAHAEFFMLDDPPYVTTNKHVQAGLTGDSIRWALTNRLDANYHPVTMLSHMLDVQLFGLNPRAHHLVNLVFHLISANVLFFAILRMTGFLWRSAFIAAVFALHPQHVESVAWVAERKDVLSGMFFMLCLLTYSFYAEKQTWGRYLTLMALYALGLLSKPMLVSLPIILLLLDYWPLKRTEPQWKLVLEKIPLFVLAGVFCLITMHTQGLAGAIGDYIPIPERLANAVVSVVRYVGAAFGPFELSVFYPLVDWPAAMVFTAAISLLLVTIIVLLFRRAHPEWLVGWLWFLVMLIPVIGIVQVGQQSMADRYSYLPSIGLSLIATWFVSELFTRLGHLRWGAAIAIASLVLLFAKTQAQAEQWVTSEANLLASINVVGPDSFLCQRLGVELWTQGRRDDAMDVFRVMMQTDPTNPRSYQSIGEMLKRDRQPQAAERYYLIALQIDPTSVKILLDLADAFQMHGDYEHAIAAAQHAVDLEPENQEAIGFLEELRQDQAKHTADRTKRSAAEQ